MRVSQNMIYTSAIRDMNGSLSELMRLNSQNSAQKTLLRPSDDPLAWAESLDTRGYLAELARYEENIDLAEGWLNLADDTLNESEKSIIRIRELAEQAATGTLNDDQRDTVATEMRELFDLLVSQANTDFAGSSIFAGQETDEHAYTAGLAGTVFDETLDDGFVLNVSGTLEQTALVEFQDGGTVGVDGLDYRYSLDAGRTWVDATLAAGDTTLDIGGARVFLETGSVVTAPAGSDDGTAIMVRPAAFYQGDGLTGTIVTNLGGDPVTATTRGAFPDGTLVRIDANATLPGPVEYSYSQDMGASWQTGNTASNSSFPVAGGFLDLAPAGAALTAGSQFMIMPDEADITVDIGVGGNELVINNVGWKIFGGRYVPEGSDESSTVPLDEEANLLETVGRLVGFLESNNLDGIGESLEWLDSAHKHFSSRHSGIGGRENRAAYARDAVEMATVTGQQRLSNLEDADITQVMTDITRAETVYQAVLQTSSSIMGMSLLKYI